MSFGNVYSTKIRLNPLQRFILLLLSMSDKKQSSVGDCCGRNSPAKFYFLICKTDYPILSKRVKL